MKRILVLQEARTPELDGLAFTTVADFDDAKEAYDWLKSAPGGTYTVVSQLRAGVTVRSESVTKTTLEGGTQFRTRTPKPKLAEAPKPDTAPTAPPSGGAPKKKGGSAA